MGREKRWWEYLLDLLAGAFAKQALRGAGATPAQMEGALTMSIPLGNGYTAPVPPAGVLESRDLAHCHPELQRRYLALQADFERETGRQLFLTCTWRSKERQQALYAQGRTAPGKIVTKVDGVTRRSRHQVYPAEAVDVCVDIDPGPGKHPVWDGAAYRPLGALALRHGLVWGGDWDGDGDSADERFLDYPHLELPAGAA